MKKHCRKLPLLLLAAVWFCISPRLALAEEVNVTPKKITVEYDVFQFEGETEDESRNVILYGNANHTSEGYIELTPLQTWCSGSVWYAHQISTKEGFRTSVKFWAGGGRGDSYGGADGFALTFSETNGLGADGGYLGFVGNGAYGVELDSWKGNSGDPSGKHVAIIHNSSTNHLAYALDDRVDDSEWHELGVSYEGTVLRVYLDGELLLSNDTVQLPEYVYLGISAATGAGLNRHMIDEFKFEGVVSKGTSFEDELSYVTGVKYASGSERDYSALCYFSDRYFFLPSCGSGAYDGYNPSLSTASLCFALSAFGSNECEEGDYSKKYQNAQRFLKELEFRDISYNQWFTLRPQSDSIGVIAANKKITVPENGVEKEYTLIAVAVRGGGYESEWAGNFTLGKSGQHFGFRKAKEQVLDFLKNYIAQANITGNVKLWLVGYSRAGATANLTAAAINDGELLEEGINLKKEDFYAYCFEAPQGGLTSETGPLEKYNNIYNIININDVVTKVAMDDLGFGRYGVDYYLPARITDGDSYDKKLSDMLSFYNTMESYRDVLKGYYIDAFVMKKFMARYLAPGGESPIQDDPNQATSLSAFLDEVIHAVTTETIESRENYVSSYQNGIRVVLTALNGTLFPESPVAQVKQFGDLLIDKLTTSEMLMKAVEAVLNNDKKAALVQAIQEAVEEAMLEAGINDLSPSKAKEFVQAVVDLLIDFSSNHFDWMVTLLSNFDGVKSAHYPELCLAWLMSQDPNYVPGKTEATNLGNYRIIRINCPIDVEVYNKQGKTVAVIRNDVVQKIGENHLEAGVNEAGEKVVYLPANGEYSVRLIATDDGTMSYSVSDYSSAEGGIVRIQSYENVVIRKGEVLQAQVSAYSPEELKQTSTISSCEYRLIDGGGNVCVPNKVLSGKEAQKASFSVEAVHVGKGNVTGSGRYYSGSFAAVRAYVQEGYVFYGWYEDGKMVSGEVEYRFPVNCDRKLEARFGTEGEAEEEASEETSSSPQEQIPEEKNESPEDENGVTEEESEQEEDESTKIEDELTKEEEEEEKSSKKKSKVTVSYEEETPWWVYVAAIGGGLLLLGGLTVLFIVKRKRKNSDRQ